MIAAVVLYGGFLIVCLWSAAAPTIRNRFKKGTVEAVGAVLPPAACRRAVRRRDLAAAASEPGASA